MIAIVCIVCLTVFMCCALVCATVRDVASKRCQVERPRSLMEALYGGNDAEVDV